MDMTPEAERIMEELDEILNSEIVTLELKVEVEYENNKTRDWLLQRLPKEIKLDISGGGIDGSYSMKLKSTEIQK